MKAMTLLNWLASSMRVFDTGLFLIVVCLCFTVLGLAFCLWTGISLFWAVGFGLGSSTIVYLALFLVILTDRKLI